MSTEIQATKRDTIGKGAARRTRTNGMVPAVVYSGGKAAEAVSVEPRGLTKAIQGPLGRNTLLTLALPGGKRTVLLKELQIHPVARDLTHADFLEVDPNVPVRVKVPLTLTGKNKNLAPGAVVEQVTRTALVWAKPNAVPERVEVDISNLDMGSSIHVQDLKLPEGMKLATNRNETVVTVSVVKEEKAQQVTATADAAAAPGAPAAAGAAPAAAAAGKDGKAAAPAAGAAAAAGAAKAPAKK
jgi:large subunit ribosomal protein L25